MHKDVSPVNSNVCGSVAHFERTIKFTHVCDKCSLISVVKCTYSFKIVMVFSTNSWIFLQIHGFFNKFMDFSQFCLVNLHVFGAFFVATSVAFALPFASGVQAAGFLEALLAALDDEAVVGPFVPMAFRVLAPVKALGGTGEGPGGPGGPGFQGSGKSMGNLWEIFWNSMGNGWEIEIWEMYGKGIWVNFITSSLSERSLEIIVSKWEIIPFYGRTIQVSELL